MTDLYKESIDLHRAHGGKISINTKVPLDNRHDLAVSYSPGVGGVSKAIGADTQLVRDLTIKKNTVAIVSDGSAILGLGNLGPEAAIPVMEGKAALFKKFADIDAFPICLDTQNTEEIIKTVQYIAPVFGGINLEDISAPRCFEIEQRLKDTLSIPVMHDDQHGTAIVTLAGLINAAQLRGSDKNTMKVVVNGVGAAGVAITNILLQWGVQDIILCDSMGIISDVRQDLNPIKQAMQRKTNKNNVHGGLQDALRDADVFIGVSVAGLLTPELIQLMKKDPIIFALANPEPEIMPDVAKKAGAFVVATGRSDFPNQVNNILAFPGIFRGALDHNVTQLTQEMFVATAHAIAECVHDKDTEHIVPDVFDARVTYAVSQVIR